MSQSEKKIVVFISYHTFCILLKLILGFDDPFGLKIDKDYRQYEKLCQRKEILLKQLLEDFQLLR